MTPAEAHQLLIQGYQHHTAGQYQQAEVLYRQVLRAMPNHPEAHYLLGTLAMNVRQLKVAIELLNRAVALNPNSPQFQITLAQAHYDAGNLPAAAEHCQRAIALNPNEPEYPNTLANILLGLNQPEKAIDAYQTALRLAPDYVEPYSNMAEALRVAGRCEEAVQACQQAIKLAPDFVAAYVHLGNALRQLTRYDEAAKAFEKAIALDPKSSLFYCNLGLVQRDQGKLAQSIATFRRGLELDPNDYEIRNNLSIALQTAGQLEQAENECRIALRLRPNYAKALGNLGDTLRAQGRTAEALPILRQATQLDPGDPLSYSNYLLALHYDDALDPSFVAREHFAFEAVCHRWTSRPRAPHDNDRSEHRRLRIGYVSSNFRQHSVAYFLEPILAHHDRDRFEVFCYADELFPDATTEHLRQYADNWRSVTSLSHEALARLIRKEKIDILIDLNGHTGENRLPAFALKPAPVQISYLGYPDTTGLKEMDYRLTDPLADPPGTTEAFHSETLIRLPTTAWCYRPDASIPNVAPLPALSETSITFGTFNAMAKINPRLIAIWSDLLHAVPTSRLILKNKSFRDSAVRRRVLQSFIERNIDPDRIILLNPEAHHENHLRLYDRLDIALDTFPYNGTTTTLESLWMGVPVVTLAGQVHVSRVGQSLLNSIGLPHLVAHDAGQYVQIAKTLAEDLHQLNQLRQTLRDRLRSSALSDEKGFAVNLENAYRTAWKKWASSY